MSTLQQNHFRFRTDTGDVDASPTWAAAEDVNFYPGDATFRLRFSLQNIGSDLSIDAMALFASLNGGTFAAVTGVTEDLAGSATASSSPDGTTIVIPQLDPPPVWTPLTSLANLVGYWTAAAGITQSGGAVSAWQDQSPNGFTLTQANGTNKPSYSPTGFNTSYPGVTFVAANPSYMNLSTFNLNASDLSIFVLFFYTSNNPAGNDCGLVSLQAVGTGDDINNPSFDFEVHSTDQTFMHSTVTLGNGGVPSSTSPNTIYQMGTVCDATNVTQNRFVNGAVVGSPTTQAGLTFGGVGNSSLTFGSREWLGFPAANSFDGTIAYVIITSGVMSAADIGNLLNWTNAHWGTSF